MRDLTDKEKEMLKVLEKHEYYFNSINENNYVTVRNAYTMQRMPFNPPLLIDMYNFYKDNKASRPIPDYRN